MGVPPSPVAPGVSGPRLCKVQSMGLMEPSGGRAGTPNPSLGSPHLLPASLPLPFPHASLAFDLLITASLVGSFGSCRS